MSIAISKKFFLLKTICFLVSNLTLFVDENGLAIRNISLLVLVLYSYFTKRLSEYTNAL